MARHEIVIHENTSATSAVAPYLGNYIAKETLALAAFASASSRRWRTSNARASCASTRTSA